MLLCMKRIHFFTAMLTAALLFISCAGGPGTTGRTANREADDLINRIAEKAVPLLPADRESNIAVYYFTVDGKESPYSDYLINGLTTEMANRAPANCHILSRKGLDRVMDEYSFQLSDLVSEETQVDIGELLGADTIITGFITSMGDRNNINIQLIDVHSGAVIGGFSLDFSRDISIGDRDSSEVITMERKYVESVGAATKTYIHETFDGPIAVVTPGFFEEHWGDRIQNLEGFTEIDPEGFAALYFSAVVDSNDFLTDWDDSNMTFYMDLPLESGPEENNGIYVRLRPEGFSRIYLMVRQTEDGEQRVIGTPVTLQPGEWTDLRIPFSEFSLFDGEERVGGDSCMSITVGIPYMENVLEGFFPGINIDGRLSVDEIGLYSLKSEKTDSPVISSFEDEILTLVPALHTEGALIFTDYSTDDSGIRRLNVGIESQNLSWKIEDGGPVGRYLAIRGTYTINRKILTFIGEGGEMALVADFHFSVPREDFGKLSFLMSSEGLSTGYLYLSDPENGESFESDFRSGRSWARVSIPFEDRLYGDDDTGAHEEDPYLLRMIWSIPAQTLEKAAREGTDLNIAVNLDELSWE